ncbi:hypothetical protein [Staphylococcus canis]|uniref:Phage protein n=1 Tax=Staphylococcus canis TaxID=2724942 RepID=A0ABS0TBR3_9STAP|nr:hypothetical protein [Staphylococcus canis]MBI5975184.1 hypothetical protein [Staphylococcus canis]
MFNLYNERKEALVVVQKLDDYYRVKGLSGGQLEFVDDEVEDIETFKNTFGLLSYEELGQIDMNELLTF